MDEKRVFRAEFQAHLANGFEERQRLNIAHCAADFHDHHIHAIRNFLDGGFDFVGNVRNHLHGFAEVIATAFLGKDGFVDAAGGPVVGARKVGVRKALVVAEVEVRLGAVFGDKHLAVLKGTHGARVHVQVGIALL